MGSIIPKRVDKSKEELVLIGWSINDHGHLYREYHFINFKKAFDFVSHVAVIAEEMDHHPFITLEWGRATVEIWTHVSTELTEKDMILASKMELIINE